MNNKTALEVNNISDTSKYMEQETDQMTDSSLSDKEQITNMTHSDNTNKSLEDKTVDKYNKASDNSKDNTVNAEGTDKKLSNIEKYNMTLNSAEHKEQCRQAGIKSGEVRRERKTLGEELKLILAQGDNQEQLCLALFKSALSGNYKAFNSLRDTIGEMPTQKQEVTTSMTDGDRELLANVQKRLSEQNVTK